MNGEIIVLILINIIIICSAGNLNLEFTDEQGNIFDYIPKSHQNNDVDDYVGMDDEEKSQNNLYRHDLSSDYRRSIYHYDWMNSKPFREMTFEKNQTPTMKRNILNNATSINSQNDKDLSNTFINNTLNDASKAKQSNLLAPVANNNGTNELEDLKEMLNQIYEELDVIKTTKMCLNKDPDGNDCDVNGVWNAAEIGLRIELSTSSASNANKLVVNLAEKIPKKPTYRIDTTWKCSGSAVHKNGGPFYFHCTNHQSPQSMIIFHGICKKCSGFDTIFGEWIFQHIPSDCRQLWTFSETKRDVFHKYVKHHKNSSIDYAINNHTTIPTKINIDNAVKAEKFRRNSKYFRKFGLNRNFLQNNRN